MDETRRGSRMGFSGGRVACSESEGKGSGGLQTMQTRKGPVGGSLD